MKKFEIGWITGKSLYAVIRNHSTNEYLQASTGLFGATVDEIPLVEDSTIPGLFLFSEDRESWINDEYSVAVFEQSGTSPNLTNDTLIANEVFQTIDDTFIAISNLPTTINGVLSSSHGAGLWGSTETQGIFTIDIVTKDTNTPAGIVPFVYVQIMTSDNISILTSGKTNSQGVFQVNLDEGTYKVRLYKFGMLYTPVNTLVVTGDATVTYTADSFVPTIPEVGVQTIYGWVKNLDGSPKASEAVTAVITKSQTLDSSIFNKLKLSATTDAEGYFELFVAKGVEVYVESVSIRMSFTVTNDDTKTLSSYYEA